MKMLLALAVLGCAVEMPPARAVESLEVDLPASLAKDAAGRLLVFARPATGHPREVESWELVPAAVSVAGRDVQTFGSQRKVVIDLDVEAVPKPFSELPPGDYWVQAVLDPQGDYGRYGRGPGDLVSEVARIHLPLAPGAHVDLGHALPPEDIWDPPGAMPYQRDGIARARPRLTDFKIPSPLLSAFWGRAQDLQAWVWVPPDYDPHGTKTWPTVYVCAPFDGNYADNLRMAGVISEMSAVASMPSMVWVMLDYSTLSGTTEFADSVNNGPWEKALLQELIPALEKRFRMDARPSGRLLMGHSSGGWASVWLEVGHPDVFGGAWATAPDPVDFRDFMGVNLYEPGANVYFDSHGVLRPSVRHNGTVTGTQRDSAHLEEVLGHAGGSFQSFDWVFSPRADDGRAARMFDRVSGAVNPAVAAYWRDHYDISWRIAHLEPQARHSLGGKLHITVGDQDTFYLDGAVHRLQEVLQQTGVAADIHFLPGRDHNNLLGSGGDPVALLREFARQMHAAARPRS
jgi:S-formylglutathione hydrolase FrmB